MGEVIVQGIGKVMIAGDAPTPKEADAIIRFLMDREGGTPSSAGDIPSFAGGVPPNKGDIPLSVVGLPPSEGGGLISDTEVPPIVPRMQQESLSEQGLFGIVPNEFRSNVRRGVERQAGLFELLAEIAPSFIGGVAGGIGGAALGGPAGAFFGASAGSVIGEGVAQETGIAPRSDLNIGLAAAGPAIGGAVGKGLQLGGRAIGGGFTRLPFVKRAVSLNADARSAADIESAGTRILAAREGSAIGRPADVLYQEFRDLGGKVTPSDLQNTAARIVELTEELKPLQAFDPVRAAISTLEDVRKTLLTGGDVSIDTIVKARSNIGVAIRAAEGVGAQVAGSAKQIFGAISDDLDAIASRPGLAGEAAKAAKVASARAKLEFAVKDFEGLVSRFGRVNADGSAGVNLKGLLQRIRRMTNPADKFFDKNFSTALEKDLPKITESLEDMIKAGQNATGGDSLIVRGRLARALEAPASAIGGAILGNAIGGPVIGGLGAVIGAGLPEALVGMLVTPKGRALLEAASRLGKGEISQDVFQALGITMLRSLGDGESVDQSLLQAGQSTVPQESLSTGGGAP